VNIKTADNALKISVFTVLILLTTANPSVVYGSENDYSIKERYESIQRIDSASQQLRQSKIDVELLEQANARLESRIEELLPQEERALDLEQELEILNAAYWNLDAKMKRVLSKNQELETKVYFLAGFSHNAEHKTATQNELNANLKLKDQELQNMGKMVDDLSKEQALLRKENEELRQSLASLIETNKQEKAALYEKLGMAYIQSQAFDLAIEAYEQALDIGSLQSQAHYHLGLLYRHAQNDTRKSKHFFQKYLELEPKAKNRKEVEYLIKAMER
jgi:tetratricopeptide (TPR) repeat protein